MMLDHNAMPQSGFSAEQKDDSGAERMARSVIEQSCGHRLTDGEWAAQRRRLIEFVLTLARWDAEQRRTGEVKSIDSEPESTGLGLGDKECNTNHRSGD